MLQCYSAMSGGFYDMLQCYSAMSGGCYDMLQCYSASLEVAGCAMR